MPTQSPQELMQLITVAVTPVVMVSVGAVLILGINSKHQSIADRARTLTAEFRHPDTPAVRRNVITEQMHLFRRRVHYAAAAQRLLYAAIGFFLATVILIIGTQTRVAFGLFLAGVLLMLAAVILEFLELRLATQTLDLEMRDCYRI